MTDPMYLIAATSCAVCVVTNFIWFSKHIENKRALRRLSSTCEHWNKVAGNARSALHKIYIGGRLIKNGTGQKLSRIAKDALWPNEGGEA